VEKQREYEADYRFNQAGGGADKQLVADGGAGADDAAQRVEKQREYEADYRFNQAGGGADKQLVADGGPEAIDAAQRVAMEAARIRARPGGHDDKQLVADGGPEAIDAAQRVEERLQQKRQYNARYRAKHPCHQPTLFVASWWEMLEQQQQEFQAWQQAYLADWLHKE
jgi:hypothetical protein